MSLETPGPFDQDPSLTKETKEQPELRFAEIYKSHEWKSLPKLNRAQLVLVAEGLKSGAFIGGDYTNFQKIIKKIGLETKEITEKGELEPVYEVASPKEMSRYYQEWLTLPEKTSPWDEHFVDGKFLGYPKCCTEEYIRAGKQEHQSGKKIIPKFVQEIKELLEKRQEYPEEFDFRPPTFTPCSVNCEESLQQLKKYKEILQLADPEAAQELKEFNKNAIKEDIDDAKKHKS